MYVRVRGDLFIAVRASNRDDRRVVSSRRSWCVAALLATACGAVPPARDLPFELSAGTSSGDVDDGVDSTAPTASGDEGGTAGVSETTGDAATSAGLDSESSGEGTTGEESDCPRVRVVVGAGENLNVRPDPSTAQSPIGTLGNGAIVDVLDEAIGEDVNGNPLWYLIDNGSLMGWVSAVFAECTFDEPPEIDEDGWYLPLACGMSATISQGNFGTTSHTGMSAYAFDFAIPLGTPLVAMASGTVTHAYDQTGPGDPCYNGGGPECISEANYVTMAHADGTLSSYAHLQSVSVGVGDVVGVGQQVGLSGSTGYSTGRHAHVARLEDCGASYCQSIPVAFNDVPGDGVPVTGQGVTSGNCP